GPEGANCQPFIHAAGSSPSTSSAREPSSRSAVSWRRTSSSDQKIFTRLASGPVCPPSIRRVTVQNVCHRYASASIHARTTASRTVGSESTAPWSARRRDRSASRAAAAMNRAEHVAVGHEHVLEEHLGEPLVTVETFDRAHCDSFGAQVDEEVREAVVALGFGVASEQAEQTVTERAPRRPRLLARQPPAAVRLVAHGA